MFFLAWGAHQSSLPFFWTLYHTPLSSLPVMPVTPWQCSQMVGVEDLWFQCSLTHFCYLYFWPCTSCGSEGSLAPLGTYRCRTTCSVGCPTSRSLELWHGWLSLCSFTGDTCGMISCCRALRPSCSQFCSHGPWSGLLLLKILPGARACRCCESMNVRFQYLLPGWHGPEVHYLHLDFR